MNRIYPNFKYYETSAKIDMGINKIFKDGLESCILHNILEDTEEDKPPVTLDLQNYSSSNNNSEDGWLNNLCSIL